MRSFAAIATFATLAFSAVTSAIPVGPSGLLPAGVSAPKLAAPKVRDVSNVDVTVSAGKRDVGNTLTGLGAPDAGLKPRGGDEYQGIPDILVALNDKVVPLCHGLTDQVQAAASADAALKVSLEVLGEVKDLVFAAKADIEALVAANVAGILTLKGKVLSVSAIAQILATLVIAINTVVGIIVKILATVDIKVLLALVVEISGAVAAIIAIVLKLSAGVLVELQGLVKVVVDVIISLKLEALIQVLQLSANVQA